MPGNSLELDACRYKVCDSLFEVPKRYTVFEPLGEGTYGKVCLAKDEVKGKLVAVKKIENSFDHLSSAIRTLRELKILRHLRHENVMRIRNVFVAGNKEDFEDVYIVSDVMETDLGTILRSDQPLMDEHRQFFLYQILRGMKYIHSAGVIHRDLKPRNLLVNASCSLKIADLGMARVSRPSSMTEYVCTRWYRAPEVLCAWDNYSAAVDVWSIGCIFAEMFLRHALFRGSNTQQMLELIVSFLGTPSETYACTIPNARCRSFMQSLPHSRGQDFADAFPDASPSAVEVLESLLNFDPDDRATVPEALASPYLAELSCPEDEPVRGPIGESDFEFERRKVDAGAVREELFSEALRYHPELHRRYVEEQATLGYGKYDITRYRLLAEGETMDTPIDW